MSEATPKVEDSTANLDVTKYKVAILALSRIRMANVDSFGVNFFFIQIAADIVNSVMKRLVELCVEGAKILDLCTEGDQLIEQGTGAVYNKSVKGVKVSKGSSLIYQFILPDLILFTHEFRPGIPHFCIRQQRCSPFFTSRLRSVFLTNARERRRRQAPYRCTHRWLCSGQRGDACRGCDRRESCHWKACGCVEGGVACG